MFYSKREKGQNTAEYAIVIALVVGVAMAMQIYVNRGLKSGVKFATDNLPKITSSRTSQYEPYYLQSEYNTTMGAGTDTEATALGGGVSRESASSYNRRAGYQKTKAVE